MTDHIHIKAAQDITDILDGLTEEGRVIVLKFLLEIAETAV